MDVLARSRDALQAFLTRPPAKNPAALAASPSWAAPRPCWALVGLRRAMELAPPAPEAPAAAAAKTRRLSDEPSTGRRRRVNLGKALMHHTPSPRAPHGVRPSPRFDVSEPPPGRDAAHEQELQKLREELDSRVVGQSDVKQAILLGLLAKEHVYVEGPPGVAKTMLSEVAASATGSSVYSYQFHRDSRLDELVGDLDEVPECEHYLN